jgi:hypothetical protein
MQVAEIAIEIYGERNLQEEGDQEPNKQNGQQLTIKLAADGRPDAKDQPDGEK